MALKHSVYDTDTHFTINPNTRVLKNESMGKTSLIQYDHNSERFTFEIPRYIEGHDMSLCDVVQIHYNNIDSQTKEQSKGVYAVDDMQIYSEDNNVVILSWLISGNATKYVGSLNFLVRFECTDDDKNAIYVWNTAIYSNISVGTGIDNGEAVAYEYADILEQWKEELHIDGIEDLQEDVESLQSDVENLETDIEDLKTGEIVNLTQYMTDKKTLSALNFKVSHRTSDPYKGQLMIDVRLVSPAVGERVIELYSLDESQLSGRRHINFEYRINTLNIIAGTLTLRVTTKTKTGVTDVKEHSNTSFRRTFSESLIKTYSLIKIELVASADCRALGLVDFWVKADVTQDEMMQRVDDLWYDTQANLDEVRVVADNATTNIGLLVRNNSINLFDRVSDKEETIDGITYSWSKNNSQLTVTASDPVTTTTDYLLYSLSMSDLPEGINVGDTLTVTVSGVSKERLAVREIGYRNDGGSTSIYTYNSDGSYPIRLRDDTSHIEYKIAVRPGSYTSGASLTLTLQNAPSNTDLDDKIADLTESVEDINDKISDLNDLTEDFELLADDVYSLNAEVTSTVVEDYDKLYRKIEKLSSNKKIKIESSGTFRICSPNLIDMGSQYHAGASGKVVGVSWYVDELGRFHLTGTSTAYGYIESEPFWLTTGGGLSGSTFLDADNITRIAVYESDNGEISNLVCSDNGGEAKKMFFVTEPKYYILRIEIREGVTFDDTIFAPCVSSVGTQYRSWLDNKTVTVNYNEIEGIYPTTIIMTTDDGSELANIIYDQNLAESIKVAGLTITDVSESTEDGGSNVVTFSDGTTLTVKNGKTGANGATGANGYTPVKGTDYFTNADKAELVEDVLEALPTWTGGSY